jgi:cellulose synthase/poly-beta-1,6-N-acetylglucosamine synthase-like glycosyltransferase
MRSKIKSLAQSVLVIAVFYALAGVVVFYAIQSQPSISRELLALKIGLFLVIWPLLVKFIIQLMATLCYPLLDRVQRNDVSTQAAPKVSVLIPAWNEEVGIIKTLRSVLAARYPDFEVVVINDGSTDRTHELVSDFIRQHQQSERRHIEIKYLRLSNGGKAKAMNQGLKVANGEFVITIDADSVMDPMAIQRMIKRFDNDKVAGVAGNVIIANRYKPIELMQQLEYLVGFFFKRADSVMGSLFIIGGAAAAYRKSVLERIGGFDETIITEDIELSTRLLKHGYITRYAHDAIVYTEGPSDLASLCRQRLRWKHGRLLTFIKHRDLFFSCSREHSVYLTWMALPLSVYGELLLLLEGVILGLFGTYMVMANDYLPLLFTMLIFASLVVFQVVSDPKARFHLNLLVLAPVAWIFFYCVDGIEFQALVRSLKRMLRGEALQWQRWNRVGIVSSSVSSQVLE